MTKALVLFSGGQDSTTCLAWAQFAYEEVEAFSVQYGQRHLVEMEAAGRIAELLGIPHSTFSLPDFGALVDSSLTGSTGQDVNEPHPRNEKLPSSWVPNRNAMMLTLAHAYAQRIGAEVIVGGMCSTDYSGYPDCRPVFIEAMQLALNAGAESAIEIVTPLMHLTKAKTFAFAADLGQLDLVIEHSHTCYNGVRDRHPWGYGCAACPACLLRSKGWDEYQQQLATA